MSGQTYRNMPDRRTWQVNIKLVRWCFRHIGPKVESPVKICSLLRSGNNFLISWYICHLSEHNFFSQQIILFHKTLMMIMIMKMNVMISMMSLSILNKYCECHEITEYLQIYSWSKHVKQINEFLIAMRYMWWHFRFLFGQTVFLNCLTECQTSCLVFSICLSGSVYVV